MLTKNLANILYLFFLKYPIGKINKTSSPSYHVDCNLFMFENYLWKRGEFIGKRLYEVYEKYAVDINGSITLANLKYHKLIDEKERITELGEEYLQSNLKRFPKLIFRLKEFCDTQSELSFLEGTFLEKYHFDNSDDFVPVSFLNHDKNGNNKNSFNL